MRYINPTSTREAVDALSRESEPKDIIALASTALQFDDVDVSSHHHLEYPLFLYYKDKFETIVEDKNRDDIISGLIELFPKGKNKKFWWWQCLVDLLSSAGGCTKETGEKVLAKAFEFPPKNVHSRFRILWWVARETGADINLSNLPGGHSINSFKREYPWGAIDLLYSTKKFADALKCFSSFLGKGTITEEEVKQWLRFRKYEKPSLDKKEKKMFHTKVQKLLKRGVP